MTTAQAYDFAYNKGLKAGIGLIEQANLCRMLILSEHRREEINLLIRDCKELLKNQA